MGEMVKKKLIDDIKNKPSRFYRAPADVIRDRRFRDDERLEILNAWQNEAEAGEQAEVLLQQLMDVKKELERKAASGNG